MKYLGIDFGFKRIGLAISEGELASPLKILEIKNFNDAVIKIDEVVKGGGFEKIVIGLPEGKIGKIVLKFVNAIKKKGLDIECADETLSSKKALQEMIDLNVSQKSRSKNDSVAAAIILQNYLDNL